MDLVNSILTHPDIWADISGGLPEFDAPYMPNCLYFMVNDGDGVIIYNPFLDGMEIHPNFIPEKRGKYAYQAIEQTIQTVFSMGYKSIYAEIDVELIHVIRCAKHLGFNQLKVDNNVLLVRRKLDS